MGYRLGVDIGGTFTDLALMDDATGNLVEAKVSSTPSDPALGFVDGVRRITALQGISSEELDLVVHGTTVATNALLQRSFAEAGLIVTKGYRGILEYARGNVKGPFGTWLFYVRPPRVVPLERVREVTERVDSEGRVLTQIDLDEVATVADFYRRTGIACVGVSLLWSFKNREHEDAIRTVFEEVYPECDVVLSADVLPEVREYERAFTTAASAALKPVVGDYLAGVKRRLRAEGVRGKLLCMKSSGGVVGFPQAASHPIEMALSGPAAGVLGMAELCSSLGFSKAITVDMGGTSTDLSFIEDARPLVSMEGEINEYPIRVPMIDVHAIGAGGGSIAWIAAGRKARVGPKSAGADPGPAAYGNGGEHATVTDANLVLGRFPARLLGGEVELDRELALAAVRRFGDELGLDEVEAAHTIVELAVHNMEMAIREVSTRKGRDPRECVLVAFGGAGPAHAGRLAELLHVERILYPHSPGVGSTLGLLSTDVRRDYVQSLVVPLTDPEAPSALTAALVAMRSRGWESLDEEGVPDERRALRTAVDLRYARQQYTITVPLAWEEDDGGALDDAAAAFHAEHGRLCGFHYAADATMGVEVVNVRLTAIGRLERPQPASLASGASSAPPVAERRGVYFEAAADFVETPIFLRSDLRAGNVLKGPAIVEGFESTVVLPPGQVGEIDKHGNLIVTVAPSQR